MSGGVLVCNNTTPTGGKARQGRTEKIINKYFILSCDSKTVCRFKEIFTDFVDIVSGPEFFKLPLNKQPLTTQQLTALLQGKI